MAAEHKQQEDPPLQQRTTIAMDSNFSNVTIVEEPKQEEPPQQQQQPQEEQQQLPLQVDAGANDVENTFIKWQDPTTLSVLGQNPTPLIVDFSHYFVTDQVFDSREDILHWCQEVGKENNTVLVISKSTRGHGKGSRLELGCERGGVYKDHKGKNHQPKTNIKRKRESNTRKCDCPFKLKCVWIPGDKYKLVVKCGNHNHDITDTLTGNAYAQRLKEEEKELVVKLTTSGLRAREVLSALKEKNKENHSTMRTIYNARAKLRLNQMEVKPPIQQVTKRLEKFKTTIFTQMSMLANKYGAINLGQGFPNFDGPEFVKEAAIQAIRDGKNQYARGYGVADLNSAIAARFRKDTGIEVDPEKEVTVTSGCTEAIAATMLGLINPGDEVILFAPFYDSYEATLSMAGAKIKSLTLEPPDFSVPLDKLKSAFSKNTRAILINTPHNPTGKMFSREELETIAALCIENDVLIFTDEVYDKLAFEADHISMASLPGMYERTVTMNSLGKTFSLTGWKIGWAIAPAHLTWGVRQAHSYLTFATSTPMQWAAAAALRAPDSYYEEMKRDYMSKKAILLEGLQSAGFIVYPSSGTYFIMVDHTPFGFEDDVAFCEYLIREVGVVAIPTSVFYLNPEEGKNLVRFTFCKDEDTLRAAVARMKGRLKERSEDS